MALQSNSGIQRINSEQQLTAGPYEKVRIDTDDILSFPLTPLFFDRIIEEHTRITQERIARSGDLNFATLGLFIAGIGLYATGTFATLNKSLVEGEALMSTGSLLVAFSGQVPSDLLNEKKDALVLEINAAERLRTAVDQRSYPRPSERIYMTHERILSLPRELRKRILDNTLLDEYRQREEILAVYFKDKVPFYISLGVKLFGGGFADVFYPELTKAFSDSLPILQAMQQFDNFILSWIPPTIVFHLRKYFNTREAAKRAKRLNRLREAP